MTMRGIDVWGKLKTALCLMLMLGFVACADDDEVVEVFDENRFFTDFDRGGFFDAWDLDDNGLDEDEFDVSFFETWDLDDDGILEETEFDAAVVDFGLDGADWTAWDTDADGILDINEFGIGLDAYGYYDAWDLDNDGFVMEREYTDGIFGLWDVDGDGILAPADYNTFYDRYYVI